MSVVILEKYPRLDGKVVLITGASAGIGAATAKHFAYCGAKIIATARRLEKLEELKKEILALNPSAHVLIKVLDVTNHKDTEDFLSKLPEEWREIDILVNNAGLALGYPATHENTPEAIDIVLDTNVKGVLFMIREIVPTMIKRNRGHVINVSSIAGVQAYKNGSLYCASKHAVEAITTSLLKELAPTKIRVTSIRPGLVETEFTLVRTGGSKEMHKQTYDGLDPLTGADIADNIVYVASRPEHVQIAEMMILPVNQASVEIVHREKKADT